MRFWKWRRPWLLLASGVVWGCTVKPTVVAEAPPERPAPSEVAPSASAGDQEPPPPGEPPRVAFPTIQHRALANGLPIRVVERHQHPVIGLRLVVRSGSAADGDKPGLALLAAEMLKAGGAGRFEPLELLERADALGTDLQIRTGPDATVIGLDVTTPRLDGALELLSAVALQPKFRARELELLRSREIERLESAARGDAMWAAAMVLYRELYSQPTGVHPYARYDALPGQLSGITLADCRAWHRAQVVPSNTTLVFVGDVTPDAALAGTAKWFGGFAGKPAPEPRIEPPIPQTGRHIYLVDRPGSAQAQILVGLLGPSRQSAEWPALTAANQILGGGVSGRLFLDVRERRSLAYSTRSSITAFAVGPSALVLSAGTMTAKADEAVGALLDHLAALSQRPPSREELQGAQAFLGDGFMLELETVGSVAELTARLGVLGLPDDYYDTYRAALRELTLGQVATVAGKHFDKVPVIVVAGDAAAIGPSLSGLGPITVLDPSGLGQPRR